jgi:hypothetical protein
MAAATTSSPKIAPPAEGLVAGDDQRSLFVAGRDELEEQVRGFGFEGDVADLVGDQQRDPPQLGQLVLQPAAVVGFGEASDPLGGGGEQGALPAWQARTPSPIDRMLL